MAGGDAAQRCYAAVCRPAMPRRCSSGTSALLWLGVKALSILLPLPPALAVLSHDGQILLSFANQTGSWRSNLETWNESDSDPCGWMGVFCGSDSAVVRLDLSSWDLDTLWVQKLSSLESLRELDLSSNPGARVYGLETLTRLTRLDLSDTDPLNLHDFTSNRSADLPIRYLFADRCRPILGARAWPRLQRLSNLRVLSLSVNGMTGVIPDELRNLVNLKLLDLSYNHLSGEVRHLEGLPSLPLLILDGNNLTGIMTPPPKLQYLTARDSTPGDRRSHRMLVLVLLCTVLVGVVLLSSTFCTVYAWRKQHQQDKDLIATLLERESVILMSLRQLRTATGDFSQTSQIGVGGFGVVYAGQLEDGTAVAIKKSKCMGSPLDKQQFLNEVRILSQVNHIHLVRLLGCCLENKNALLVFEYVPNGTLEEHLQGKRGDVRCRLSWRQRLHIALQTAEALDYLHSAAQHPIFHRDVKSANILLGQHLNAKVADFGISKLAPKWATHVSTVAIQGTLGYIDPEYYTSFQLTSKSDVYSFGAVLLELISAKTPVGLLRIWEESSLVDLAISVRCKGDWGQFIDPVLLDTLASPAGRASIEVMAGLAANCLALRSRERPDMKEVRQQLQTLIDMHSDPCFDQLSNGMRCSSSPYRPSCVREQVEGMATPR